MSNARFDVPVAVKFGSPVQEKTLRTAQDASAPEQDHGSTDAPNLVSLFDDIDERHPRLG